MSNEVGSDRPMPDDFQDPLENYDPAVYRDALEEALAEQTVCAIRSQPYVSVHPDTPTLTAVEKLANLHVACLLVEEDGQLVGVFTDRDVLDKVALEVEEVHSRPLREAMTANPVFVYESDSAAAALSVMAVSGFRHVPVVDLDKKAVGIVSPHRVTVFLNEHLPNP
jgi:CBS domain-containing protein